MNKEIEEMVEDLDDAIEKISAVSEDNVDVYSTACSLYSKGYRKQSDTIKEFMDKVKAIRLPVTPDRYLLIKRVFSEIETIAKEYGVE